MASPYRVKLRAKTPSQFPTELANLDSKLVNVDTQLDLIRKGRGLFQLMKESEMEKVIDFIFFKGLTLKFEGPE